MLLYLPLHSVSFLAKVLVYCELAVDCHEGWTPHVTGERTFCARNLGVHAGEMAQSECEKWGADLPWPQTERENTDLRSLLLALGNIDEAWLGITDSRSEGEWWVQTRGWLGLLVGEAVNVDGSINWHQTGMGVA